MLLKFERLKKNICPIINHKITRLKSGGACLWMIFALPLGNSSQWLETSYGRVNKNKVTYSKNGLIIDVNKSSSPLVFKLKSPIAVKKIHVKGKSIGSIDLKPSLKQGSKLADDFLLRIGLVIPGDKTLSWGERLIAAKWVRTLFKLAPEGQGLRHVEFFNVYKDSRLKDQKRQHPLSEYFIENFVWEKKLPGTFSFDYVLKNPLLTAAIWLSADGDNTKSKFRLEIHSLTLEY